MYNGYVLTSQARPLLSLARIAVGFKGTFINKKMQKEMEKEDERKEMHFHLTFFSLSRSHVHVISLNR